MNIEEVSPQAYRRLFPEPSLAFDSVDFNMLNAAKVSEVRFLTFVDGGKVRIGLIAGTDTDGCLRAPFSAPFAGFEAAGRQRIDSYVDAAAALANRIVAASGCAHITLPPPIYASAFDRDAAAKQMPALLSAPGCRPAHIDYNYHFDLRDYGRISELMDPKARGKLRAAIRNGFEFCTDMPLDEAYDVVVENHADRGYPVHMSLSDLQATSEIVKVDCFGVTLNGEPAAAAIIYHTSASIVQLIYWGDRPAMRPLRPMNLLADKLLEHYAAKGMQAFDFGPSSSDGIPNLGLCDFKAGLGGRITPKPTIIIGNKQHT